MPRLTIVFFTFISVASQARLSSFSRLSIYPSTSSLLTSSNLSSSRLSPTKGCVTTCCVNCTPNNCDDCYQLNKGCQCVDRITDRQTDSGQTDWNRLLDGDEQFSRNFNYNFNEGNLKRIFSLNIKMNKQAKLIVSDTTDILGTQMSRLESKPLSARSPVPLCRPSCCPRASCTKSSCPSCYRRLARNSDACPCVNTGQYSSRYFS